MAKNAPEEPDSGSLKIPYKPPVMGSGIKVTKPTKPEPEKKKAEDKGIFTQEDLQKYGGWMKEPPTDPMPPMKPVKKARGGVIRGGGCEQRGKTRGRMV